MRIVFSTLLLSQIALAFLTLSPSLLVKFPVFVALPVLCILLLAVVGVGRERDQDTLAATERALQAAEDRERRYLAQDLPRSQELLRLRAQLGVTSDTPKKKRGKKKGEGLREGVRTRWDLLKEQE